MNHCGAHTLQPRPKSGPTTAELESYYHLPGGLPDAACSGTACFVARHLNPHLWAKAAQGETRVHCLGKCYHAPSCTADRLRPRFYVDAPVPILLERLVHGPARSLHEYTQRSGYQGLEKAFALSPLEVLNQVERSGLRGRGGAGFPTGKKWRIAAEKPALEKFIVANADEGDPGAFIDRFLLEDDPHCLIEAMIIAGYAVGARKGFIYLRAEYPDAFVILKRAIEQAGQAGLLGSSSKFKFQVELVQGKGSYNAGEETALLNALVRRRPVGMPRPPYAVESGLHNCPTVINNVETLANIPWILRHGGEAYDRFGFSRSRGTKLLSLNSLFNFPGLYEVQFGIPVRRIVEDLGGGLKEGELKGLMIGGPLTGVIPPWLFETKFGFEELESIGAAAGHGGVIAFDEHTSIPELIEHIFSFGAFESCGKCIPCRLGVRSIQQMFQRVARLPGSKAEEREFHEIIAALRLTSLCGFGTGLAQLAQSLVRYYPKEIAACFK